MAYPNKYKGTCNTCGTFVPKGEGIYEQGMITCTETVGSEIDWTTSWLCLPAYNATFNTNHATVEEAIEEKIATRIAEQLAGQEQVRQGLINGELEAKAIKANVRSLAQVIIKITGADIAINEMTFNQITDVRNELTKRIERKTASKIVDEFKSTNTCNRCGGAGKADKWIHTGSVCFKCGGSGKYYN